jgi:hypothetical protein
LLEDTEPVWPTEVTEPAWQSAKCHKPPLRGTRSDPYWLT